MLFGVYNALPVNHLAGDHAARPGRSVLPACRCTWLLAGLAVLALAVALVHHLIGVKADGGGLHAVDHIHYAPVLRSIYDRAEKRWFDPYDLGLKLLGAVVGVAWACDRGLDWIYDRLVVGAARGFGGCIRAAHTGNARSTSSGRWPARRPWSHSSSGAHERRNFAECMRYEGRR